MNKPRVPILPPDIRQQLDAEIRAGERLVWAGQPLPRLYWRQTLPIVLFGIPWTAFAIFWIAAAGWGTWRDGNAGPGALFPLFGVPFVLIGFGMLSSPLWMRRSAARTVYAITDQRAVAIVGRRFGRVEIQSFQPERLASITRNQRADGSGDLIFEQFQQRVGTGTTTVRRGFLAIENVREVEELITSTLAADRVRPI